jgi:hypothetical protein
MNYTETQKRLLDELANEFAKINQQFDKDGGKGKLFNPLSIVVDELETVKQIKEIDAHNDTMFEQRQLLFEEVCRKINDDIKASETHSVKIPMRCVVLRSQNGCRDIYALQINPLRADGSEVNIDVNEALRIDIELIGQSVKVGNSSTTKYVGFRYGKSYSTGVGMYNTIEDFLNTDYFQEKFGRLFRKYCVPK